MTIRFIPIFVALLASVPVKAQIISHGDLFGPGAPPPVVGIEVGFGQHAESGTLHCECGSLFTGGTGSGFLGSLFFELPLDYNWAVGVKGGIDFKNFSTLTAQSPVIAAVEVNQGTLDTAFSEQEYVYQKANVKTTYFNFTPYVQYQFYRMGPFVQGGLAFGFLSTGTISQDRELPPGTTALVNGTAFPITFTNGTDEETISVSSDANSLRIGLVLSAGYNIQISERSIFSPLITYDLPLTVSGNGLGSAWKVGSLYASALIKFQL
ncbi:MAG TPA: outer membrane beta-barrel protein [Candidatus Kapabacteria bacterium]